MSKKVTFLVAVGAVMSLALGAMAAPSVDTLLTAGYDAEEMALVFGYGDGEENDTCNNDEVTFSPVTTSPPEATESTDGDETEGVATEVETEDSLDGECPEKFYAVDVTGPNDQVNNGTVTSSFVHAVKELDGVKGIGCLVSSLKSLDLEVDQVKVSDVEEGEATLGGTTLEDATTYLVSLMSDTTRCGKPDKPTTTTLDADTDDVKGPAWKAGGEHPGRGKGKNKDK